MKKSAPLFVPVTAFARCATASIVLLCLLSAPAQVQKPKYPAPPPSMAGGIPTDPQPVPSPVTAKRHIDLVKLQQDADELSQLAQTIPADVTSVRQSMFPKDLTQKLKRIEKLSKHLRGELAP
jgi:hypothetical protein